MKIRPANVSDQQRLVQLIAEFRVELARLRGETHRVNLEAAGEELVEYQAQGFPIYVAESDDATVEGYLVCRVAGNVVWAESLYVRPEYRRRGVGSSLYAEAERLAQELGSDAPYNWVHPNNDRIVRFLQKRGYTVLNLIELRRPRAGEKTARKIRVGKHEFSH